MWYYSPIIVLEVVSKGNQVLRKQNTIPFNLSVRNLIRILTCMNMVVLTIIIVLLVMTKGNQALISV